MADTHYLALYRKYRPQTFEDVCGRDAIVRTLKNQITSGRIGHSYLFCGTRGTGKTTIAKIFAKAVNCEHPVDGSPCGECASCKAISEDANLNVVEMDAASNNGVDDVRNIIDQVAYSPTQGKYRVFIIDEVHMLSGAAFNALLKTLEEPPAYAIFILATTEPNKLPLTILSRCQRYDFGRLSVQTIEDRLKVICEREQLSCEEKALRYIASAADGSMRDGLSILDQCNAFNYGQGTLTYDKVLEILGAVDTRVFSELYEDIAGGKAAKALGILDEILSQGRELVQCVTDFLQYLRNVMLLRASEDVAQSLDVSSDNLELMLRDARRSDMNQILHYINVFSELIDQIRYSSNRRVLTEAAIIRLCEPTMETPEGVQEEISTLQERVRVLEQELAALPQGGIAPPAGTVAAAPAAAAPTQSTPKAAPKAVYPMAMTDDIKKIAASWDAVIAKIPAKFNYLKTVLFDGHPSVTQDGKTLLVVLVDLAGRGFFSADRGQENRDYFEHFLEEQTGVHVPVEYKFLDNTGDVSDNYGDIREALKQIEASGTVQMPIEQE